MFFFPFLFTLDLRRLQRRLTQTQSHHFYPHCRCRVANLVYFVVQDNMGTRHCNCKTYFPHTSV